MSSLITDYLESLHEQSQVNEISPETAGAVVGGVVGGAAGYYARKKILQKKCREKYAKDPAKLKVCMANAQRRRTDSGKGYGFK